MKIIFLGTGASRGTIGVGNSKRRESFKPLDNKYNILIDVTRHFYKQAKDITRID